MYAVMKSLIPQDEWMEHVKALSDKRIQSVYYTYTHKKKCGGSI